MNNMSVSFVILLTLVTFIQVYGQNNTIDGRIYGGEDAGEHEFPTQVSLQGFFKEEIAVSFCGGSILNEKFILTAGHCIEGRCAEKIFVSAGSIYWSNQPLMRVKKLIQHENFLGARNDIALIELSEPLVLDGVRMKAVSLPQQDEMPKMNSEAIAIGWGNTNNFISFTMTLQKITTSLTDCKGLNSYDYRRLLCIPLTLEKGTCHGDSGGPLFVDGKVVGLVHDGSYTCLNYPGQGTFTRVSMYRDWIDQHMQSS